MYICRRDFGWGNYIPKSIYKVQFILLLAEGSNYRSAKLSVFAASQRRNIYQFASTYLQGRRLSRTRVSARLTDCRVQLATFAIALKP
jgi:hypothetical protein